MLASLKWWLIGFHAEGFPLQALTHSLRVVPIARFDHAMHHHLGNIIACECSVVLDVAHAGALLGAD